MIDINNGQYFDTTTATELRESYIRRRSDPPRLYELLNRRQTGLAGLFGLDLLTEYAAELTCPIAYLKEHFPGEPIYRFILTHPDLDHIRGLAALRAAGIVIQNFWDTHNEIQKESMSDSDRRDWEAYQFLRQGAGGTVRVISPYRGDRNVYWSRDDSGGWGDGISVLAPTPELCNLARAAGDPNDHSFVLHLNAHGTKVIFGGDATLPVLTDVFNYYGDNLKCHIYKAAHHGRDSGYLATAFNAMKPEYTLVSVGKKPTTDAHSSYYRLAQGWSGKVQSTRFKGNFVIRISGEGRYTVNEENSPLLEADRIAASQSLLGGTTYNRLSDFLR